MGQDSAEIIQIQSTTSALPSAVRFVYGQDPNSPKAIEDFTRALRQIAIGRHPRDVVGFFVDEAIINGGQSGVNFNPEPVANLRDMLSVAAENGTLATVANEIIRNNTTGRQYTAQEQFVLDANTRLSRNASADVQRSSENSYGITYANYQGQDTSGPTAAPLFNIAMARESLAPLPSYA
jgi:hypothetical protein